MVTLNYVTAQAVRRAHEQLAVLSGGARLVWPDLGLEHPSYSREEVSQASLVERRLVLSLAHLSVIARGSEPAWERVRQLEEDSTSWENMAQSCMEDATRCETMPLPLRLTFNGKRWDGLPHIKVRDAVSPNEVGRIYFALDSEEKRFIVNPVGLHL